MAAVLQYFALDSNDAGYAAALSALATATAGHLSYTPAQVLRSASHDATIKLVAAVVDEAELTGSLANLHSSVYPTSLCRHRFKDLESLRVFGFHMLGESVRSSEKVAGRAMVHVARVSSGDANGGTRHDALGWDDLTGFASGKTYVFHGLLWRSFTGGVVNNADTESCATGGAASDAAGINFRQDDGLTPGMFIDGASLHESSTFNADLPYEAATALAGAGCWIKGNFFTPVQNNVSINHPDRLYDTGQADVFDTLTNLGENATLAIKATLAEVAAAETTFYRPAGENKFAAPYGAPDGVFQDDGGVVTDLTAEAASATDADVPLYPAAAAVGDALVVQHDELFNVVEADLSTAGAGDYALAADYLTAAGWVAVPNGTWCGGGAASEDFKDGSIAGHPPMFCFTPPDAWTKQSFNGSPARYTMRLRFASGTMSTSPVAGTVRVAASFVVVHLKGGADPNNAVVLADSPAYRIGINGATRVGQVRLINMNYLNPDQIFGEFTASTLLPSVCRIEGGRYLEGSHLFQNGVMNEWFIGAAEDRTPPWDTSDRPSHDDHAGIQRIVSRWGTDASGFTPAAVAKFAHMRYLTVGPHFSQTVPGGTSPGAPLWWPIDGLLIDQVGIDHKGVDRATDPDKHDLAWRGNFEPTTPTIHRRVICRTGYAHIHPYLVTDNDQQAPIAGGNSSFKDWTLQDSVIDGLGPSANNAGLFGVGFGGDGGNCVRDNGQGEKVNIKLQRVWIGNINQNDTDGAGIAHSFDAPVEYDGVTLQGCFIGIATGGAGDQIVEKLHVVVEDAGAGVFTDRTVENYSGTAYDCFPAAPAANDAIYFGCRRASFRRVTADIEQNGVGSGLTGVWEYATAPDTWAAISQLGTFSDGIQAFTGGLSNRQLFFDRDAAWVATDKGGSLPLSAFWLRFRITAGTYTTMPKVTSVDGARHGVWFVHETADKIEFLDIVGPWLQIGGLNAFYDSDRRLVALDRVTGRLRSGETIATKTLVWRSGSGGPSKHTLAQVKAGAFDKPFATTDVWQDNVGRLFANVSETPGVDIEEVP